METLDFCMPQQDDHHEAFHVQIMVDHNEEESSDNMHDTGFVLWPSAVMLARWISLHSDIVVGDGPVCGRDENENGGSATSGDILELGAGHGLVGLTAARLLAQKQQATTDKDKTKTERNVILTDYNPSVRQILQRNIELNGLEDFTAVTGLDFFDQQESSLAGASWIDMEGKPQPQVRLILAADIIAYSNDSTLVANTIQAALVEGGQAILVSPTPDRRFGLEEFPNACREVGLDVQVTPISARHETGTGQDGQLKKNLAQTSGRKGYDFQMCTVRKPIVA